ncbi:MAG TPA: hypothetical protein VFM76_02325 [Methylophaga sp.]|nr:hypothetical protein [Methylophaga sp.]
MKPQASIEKTSMGEQDRFALFVEENGELTQVDKLFEDYQAALDYMLTQGWQLKRSAPAGSLHVDIRFRKP